MAEQAKNGAVSGIYVLTAHPNRRESERAEREQRRREEQAAVPG